jgi:hypothetical protein
MVYPAVRQKTKGDSLMKRISLFLSILLLSSPCFADNWCVNPNTKLGLLFDQSENAAQDCSPQQHISAYTGAEQDPDGRYNQAMFCDGDNDLITIQDDDALDNFSAFSIGAWIKADGAQPDTGFGTVLFKGSDIGSNPQYVVWVKNTGSRIRINTRTDHNADNNWEINTDITDGNWHHLVWTWRSGEKPKAYVDGVQQALSHDSAPVSGTLENSIDHVFLCGNGTGRFAYNGYLDEVFLVNTRLDAQTIRQIMQNGLNDSDGGTALPPTLSPIGHKETVAGQELAFSVQASDMDSAQLTLTLDSATLPAGYSFSDYGNGSAHFSWTPQNGQAGAYWVHIQVEDETGLTDTETILITVIAVSGNTIEAESRGTIYLEPAGKARIAALEAQLASMSVRSDHPRIVINKDDIPRLRAKTGQPAYTNILNSANKAGVADTREAVNTAMAYLLTGNNQYANDVYQFIMNKNFDPWTTPVKYSTGATDISDACLCFDYVYDGLTASQRNNIVHKLGPLSYVDELYDSWFLQGNIVRGETFHVEEWRFNASQAWCEVALAHHYPHAEDVYKKRWDSLFYWGDAARLYVYNQDGAPFEGYYLGADGGSWMKVLESATGISAPMTWIENAAEFLFYRLDIENLRIMFNHGVAHSSGTGYGIDAGPSDPPENVYNSLAHRPRGGLSKSLTWTMAQNPYYLWIMRNIMSTDSSNGEPSGAIFNTSQAPQSSSRATWDIVDLIFDNANAPVSNPLNIGWYHKFFPDTNDLYVGTGFKSEDTRAYFRSNPCYTKTSHGDYDTASWGIYKNGHHLTNDSGGYDNDTGQKHYRGYQMITWSHNNLIAYDLLRPEPEYLCKLGACYRDPGGLQNKLNSSMWAFTLTFQSPYKGELGGNLYKVFAHNIFAHWADITGPQALATPEVTNNYVYAVGDSAAAYGDRLKKYDMHYMALKDPNDADNMWIKIRKVLDKRDNNIRLLDLVHMPVEPVISGSNPTIVTWSDYYGLGRVTMFIHSPLIGITKRQGYVVGEHDPQDQIRPDNNEGLPANTFPLPEKEQNDITRFTGAHWKETCMEWRLEIEPAGEVLDYTLYVFDAQENVPGQQPNITWDNVHKRLVVDGVIPTPQPQQHPPVLSPVGNKTVMVGQTLTFRVTATDLDNDPLSLSFSGNLPGQAHSFTDNGNGTADFAWTPAQADTGNYPNTFFVQDATGRTDFEYVVITVMDQPAQTPPVWSALEPRSLSEDLLDSFAVTCSDPDSAQVSLSAVNLPAGAEFIDQGQCQGWFSWNPSSQQGSPTGQSYTVTFIANDGTSQIPLNVTLTVYEPTADLQLTITGTPKVFVGETLFLIVRTTEPRSGVMYSAPKRPPGSTFDSNTAVLQWTPASHQTGQHLVIFKAVDPTGLVAVKDIVVTVGNPMGTNPAPVIDDPGVFIVDEGDIIYFQLMISAFNRDGLRIGHTQLPPGATWDEQYFTFRWPTDYSDAGQYTIVFTVVDQDGRQDTMPVSIVVREVDNPEEPD